MGEWLAIAKLNQSSQKITKMYGDPKWHNDSHPDLLGEYKIEYRSIPTSKTSSNSPVKYTKMNISKSGGLVGENIKLKSGESFQYEVSGESIQVKFHDGWVQNVLGPEGVSNFTIKISRSSEGEGLPFMWIGLGIMIIGLVGGIIFTRKE